MEFKQVVAPLGWDAFLAEHWETSWLHLPGAAERFSGLLSAPLTDKSRIRLAALPRLVLSAQGDKVSFNGHGKNYAVPIYVQPALALLVGAGIVLVEN
jgi:hypothetical protein